MDFFCVVLASLSSSILIYRKDREETVIHDYETFLSAIQVGYVY